jgi:hypothetical protein
VETVVRDPEAIAAERFRLHLAGVPYDSWARMTRWQIADFLIRYDQRTRSEIANARKGLGEMLSVVLGRVLGV